MQINNLFELGWTHFFQAQRDFDLLTSQWPFRVVAVQRSLIECVGLDKQGQPQSLTLPTYFWRHEPPEAYPTVGDWLLVDAKLQPVHLLSRKSLIKRRSAGKTSVIQLIAANLDTLFIVTSCNAEFNLNRIERYLSLAAEAAIDCIFVLTKADLCPDVSPFTHALSANYPTLPVEIVNATDPSSLKRLEKWIDAGQTVALLGSSGVGKSTIVNGLKGSAQQTTAPARESDNKGRHTTTSRSLHRLPGGGLLLDTPGMRELQIADGEGGIQSTFSEIDQLAAQCRFKNCQHHSEPDCAVAKAIKSGEIEPRRLENYRKLLTEQMRNNQSLAQRRRHDRALGRFYKHAQKSARRFKSKE